MMFNRKANKTHLLDMDSDQLTSIWVKVLHGRFKATSVCVYSFETKKKKRVINQVIPHTHTHTPFPYLLQQNFLTNTNV